MTKHKGTKAPPDEPSGKPKPTAETVALLNEDKKKKQAEHHDHGHKGDAHHTHGHHHPTAKKDTRDDHFAEAMLEMDTKKRHTAKRHA